MTMQQPACCGLEALTSDRGKHHEPNQEEEGDPTDAIPQVTCTKEKTQQEPHGSSPR